jgi:pilus assembly protein CpaC
MSIQGAGSGSTHGMRRVFGRPSRIAMACAGLFLCAWWIQPAASQPPEEPLVSGFQPHIPAVPAKVPTAGERFRAATSLLDNLSKNDAMFEVVLGQARLMVLKEDLVGDDAEGREGQPSIAVGNPEVTDFEIIGPRQIRLVGKRIGVTDLVVTTPDRKAYSYEVHVVYDLTLLQARILQLFPDAHVKVGQLGKNLVVEGQARDTAQIRDIVQLVKRGVLTDGVVGASSAAAMPTPAAAPAPGGAPAPAMMPQMPQSPATAVGAAGGAYDQAAGAEGGGGPEVINLLHVPGPQQVMLKVQIAELNRTALRQVGAEWLYTDGNRMTIGTRLNGNTASSITGTTEGILGKVTNTITGNSPTTAFGIFSAAGLHVMISALRQNSVVKILAEPTLVAMNGHEARFLAGGEFPVPVPQSGAGGGPATITVQYKKFGVQLNFVPYIIDGDVIRLSVDPEVSSIDFSLGIELSGTRVPGLNTRNAHTVVELREGQTLAMAGLMQLAMNNQTSRLPGIGDLPYIGPFFSNNSGQLVEKELVVLVTPYLVEAMHPDEVPARPGDEVNEPNDIEFYLFGRMQGRTGHSEFRSTTNFDDPLGLVQRMKLESRCIQGPNGFSN